MRKEEKMVLLRSLLFIISTVGTFEIIRKVSRDEVNIYFLPSLTAAIQVCVLFLAGVFNLLPKAVYGLYLVGFAGFIFSLIKERSLAFLKVYANHGYILTSALLLIFAVYLRGKLFTHYDNFSHWALVVKQMLSTNRYPNFKDSLIVFQAYPLGSASYIYYFAKLTDASEPFQMLAQTYMMLAAVLPLYAFAKKNRLAVSAVFVSFVNYVFWYNVKITDLLVDTLLPLVGVCGLLFVVLHCKDCRWIMLCFAACYMVQLTQIKNSGLFFVVFIIAVLFAFARKNKKYIRCGIFAAAPFASFLLWRIHCDRVYVDAAVSAHAMTVENFAEIFGKKSSDDIAAISANLFKFAVTYKEVWITAGICALIGVLILLTGKELRRDFLKVAVFSLVIYAVYQLGTLGMYLFSMPRGQAFGLAAADRYTKSILTAILYLNMVPAVMLISSLAGKSVTMLTTAGAVFAAFFAGMYISSGSITTVVQYEPDASEREWIEGVKEKYSVPTESSYCVLLPYDDGQYTWYLGRYIFQSTEVVTTVIHSEGDLDGIEEKYILIYDRDNEDIRNWVRDRYPEQIGNEVIVRAGE